MDKKGQESPTAEGMMDVIKFILGGLALLIIISIGVMVWNISHNKDAEVINSFKALTETIDDVLKTGKAETVAVFLTNRYDMIVFDNKGLSNGGIEKPTECGVDYCLSICKRGIFKDDCKKPLRSQKYSNIEIVFDTNTPILVRGINGIILVDISKSDNKLEIKKKIIGAEP